MFKLLRRAIFIAAASVFLFAASCDNDEPVKQPNISGNYVEESGSDVMIPSFIDGEIDNSFNLAISGTAFSDSVSADYSNYTADCINDGDKLTRWLAASRGTADDPSYFGIKWDGPCTLDVVLIYWDASHPAENGFSVDITYAEGFDAEDDVIESGEADEPLYEIIRINTEETDGQTDVILFNKPVNVTEIKITCTEPYYAEDTGAFKEYPSCYEMQVYFSEDVENNTGSEEYLLAAAYAAMID